MSDKESVGYGLCKGQTVYSKSDAQHKYEVQGYWQDYVVVLGPSRHPCLRKPDTLTKNPPKFITVTFAESGMPYTYKVDGSTKLSIGGFLYSTAHREIVKVVAMPETHNKSASFFKGFLLGDRV